MIKNKLTEKNIKFYTFTPKQNKPTSIDLKGLSVDTSIEDVATSIVNLNIENVNITKI